MASKGASDLSLNGVSNDFKLQMEGYGLATAEILYRMPDHPSVLQSFLWQEYDLCPKFPELQRFLEFWEREIEGRLHSVRVAHCGLIKPAELRSVDGLFVVH
ncbi:MULTISPECIES: usg protein [Xanthobacter]|uniref:usg protein n=1 Tax=Xanthobacter TaxID=279 RepID=UPI001F3A8712|nr:MULTISPECIES: usg protein [unclassified Xanthobacter]